MCDAAVFGVLELFEESAWTKTCNSEHVHAEQRPRKNAEQNGCIQNSEWPRNALVRTHLWSAESQEHNKLRNAGRTQNADRALTECLKNADWQKAERKSTHGQHAGMHGGQAIIKENTMRTQSAFEDRIHLPSCRTQFCLATKAMRLAHCCLKSASLGWMN